MAVRATCIGDPTAGLLLLLRHWGPRSRAASVQVDRQCISKSNPHFLSPARFPTAAECRSEIETTAQAQPRTGASRRQPHRQQTAESTAEKLHTASRTEDRVTPALAYRLAARNRPGTLASAQHCTLATAQLALALRSGRRRLLHARRVWRRCQCHQPGSRPQPSACHWLQY